MTHSYYDVRYLADISEILFVFIVENGPKNMCPVKIVSGKDKLEDKLDF